MTTNGNAFRQHIVKSINGLLIDGSLWDGEGYLGYETEEFQYRAQHNRNIIETDTKVVIYSDMGHIPPSKFLKELSAQTGCRVRWSVR